MRWPLRILFIWTAVTFLTSWLPTVRGVMDGPSYQWGTSYFGHDFGGRGIDGDYWFVAAKTALGLVMLWLGWRGSLRVFFALQIPWQMFLTADSIHNAITHPEDFRFQGDTLGIDISLAWIAPLLNVAFLVLSLFLASRQRQFGSLAIVWTRRNSVRVAIFVALLPIEFALLRPGTRRDARDQIGVIITVTQWMLLGWVLRPLADREEISAEGQNAK